MITLQALQSHTKAALAQALAELEQAPEAPPSLALLDEAFLAKRALVLGLTGPPGVGKSSLLAALLPIWRARGQSVGVIAVDPSSRRTGGALLGDRARLKTDPEDQGTFVRSMAAREQLGGLGPQTLAAGVIMAALFDILVIETVGVGQSETDIADLADLVIFCIQPGAGDSLQFMKAGIVEIPDLCVVTKADLGAAAKRAASEAQGALSLSELADAAPLVLEVSAGTGAGLGELMAALDLRAERNRPWGSRAQRWGAAILTERFGREGLAKVAGRLDAADPQGPFRHVAAISADLRKALARSSL